MRRAYRRIMIYVGAIASIWFAWYGFTEIGAQMTALRRAKPVDALIVSSSVEYESRYLSLPVVRFQYEVDGRKITGGRPFPVSTYYLLDTQSIELAAQFAPGDRVTAYYLPSKPTEAFLIRTVVFWPYFVFIASVMIVTTVAWRAFGRLGRTDRPRAPVESDGGWFELSRDRRADVFWQLGLPLMLIRFLLPTVAIIHYYQNADSTQWFAHLTALVAIGYGVFGAMLMGMAFLNRPRLAPARVFMEHRYAALGGKLKLRVDQVFPGPIEKGEIALHLVCVLSRAADDPVDRGRRERELLYEQKELIPIDERVGASGMAALKIAFRLSGGRPSTSELADDTERIDWELLVAISSDRHKNNFACFCIPVKPQTVESAGWALT